MDTSGPGWQVREGQAVWRPRPGATDFAGELAVALHPDGSAVVQFAKTPLPLVLAQRSTTAWQIDFAPQHRSFSGACPPPARWLWLYLPPALRGENLPQPLRFEKRTAENWRLENVRTGESLEGYFRR